MSGAKEDLVKYRTERADQTLQTAKNLIVDEDWFGAANRLYYAVYQIVAALMIQHDIRVKSHTGAKVMFDLHFVKTGRAETKWGSCTLSFQMPATLVIMKRLLYWKKTIFCRCFLKQKHLSP